LAVAGAVVVGVLVLAAGRTERGTGKRADAAPPPGLQEVALGQRAASDYDPLGDRSEHPDQTSAVVDGDRNSTWSTERYDGGTLPKPGVGLVLDAAPGVAARQLEIQTPTPGFTAECYVAREGLPSTVASDGWTKLAGPLRVSARERIDLDTAGNRFRRYLIWITKLPPGKESVDVSEVLLFR
ncbi:MAG: serine/threonine protein kinase, partial [Actinomycetota bacterium]|nr:serine/threonine protein kinase [Actinomycetota bacterium]